MGRCQPLDRHEEVQGRPQEGPDHHSGQEGLETKQGHQGSLRVLGRWGTKGLIPQGSYQAQRSLAPEGSRGQETPKHSGLPGGGELADGGAGGEATQQRQLQPWPGRGRGSPWTALPATPTANLSLHQGPTSRARSPGRRVTGSPAMAAPRAGEGGLGELHPRAHCGWQEVTAPILGTPSTLSSFTQKSEAQRGGYPSLDHTARLRPARE